MKRDPAVIEASIEKQFPIFFGDCESMSRDEYVAARDRVVDYAASVSQPFLSSDTVRYQTITYVSSLIIGSFGFLNVTSFKVSDAVIQLNKQSLLFFDAFLLCISLLYSLRYYVDYSISNLKRAKNSHHVVEFNEKVTIARAKEYIELYFREELEEEIQQAREIHAEVCARVTGSAYSPAYWPKKRNLDEQSFRTNAELASFLDTNRAFNSQILTELASDKERYKTHVNLIEDGSADKSFQFLDHNWISLEAAYEETLQPWLLARERWIGLGVQSTLQRKKEDRFNGRAKDHLRVLKSTLMIRKINFLMEIVFPLTLAAIAIGATHNYRYRDLPDKITVRIKSSNFESVTARK